MRIQPAIYAICALVSLRCWTLAIPFVLCSRRSVALVFSQKVWQPFHLIAAKRAASCTLSSILKLLRRKIANIHQHGRRAICSVEVAESVFRGCTARCAIGAESTARCPTPQQHHLPTHEPSLLLRRCQHAVRHVAPATAAAIAHTLGRRVPEIARTRRAAVPPGVGRRRGEAGIAQRLVRQHHVRVGEGGRGQPAEHLHAVVPGRAHCLHGHLCRHRPFCCADPDPGR